MCYTDLEIKAQLAQMAKSEPEAIFVAVGPCGTLAGLLLGARLAGLKSRIVGVRVIEENVANRPKIARMVNKARYLRRCDSSAPLIRVTPDEVNLLDDYLGPGYGHPTQEAMWAVERAARMEKLPLETTYTGKTMAALLDHATRHPGTRLLFVDTFAEAPTLQAGDYHDLPKAFWPVFDPSCRARCRCLRSWRDSSFCWKKKFHKMFVLGVGPLPAPSVFLGRGRVGCTIT